MNKELKLLYEWLCANRLSLNVAKTEFIIFRPIRTDLEDRIVLELNNTKIFESTKIKYLGLILDSRLSWKFHISESTKKLSRSVSLKSENTPQNQYWCPFIIAFSTPILHMAYQLGAILKKNLQNVSQNSKRKQFVPFHLLHSMHRPSLISNPLEYLNLMTFSSTKCPRYSGMWTME